jgi:hypothetical protein
MRDLENWVHAVAFHQIGPHTRESMIIQENILQHFSRNVLNSPRVFQASARRRSRKEALIDARAADIGFSERNPSGLDSTADDIDLWMRVCRAGKENVALTR